MSTDEPGPPRSSLSPESEGSGTRSTSTASSEASSVTAPDGSVTPPSSQPPVSDSIAPQDTREPAYPGTITETDVQRLESQLLSHGRRVRALERERRMTRRWLRELGELLAVTGSSHAEGPLARQVAVLQRQRDAAALRALEAEAARAELVFRLDEVLGHLAGAAPGVFADAHEARPPLAPHPLPDDDSELRGLRARLAEREEALDASEARVMLLEDDLVGMRDHVRCLQREMSEQVERLELELARARGPRSEPVARAPRPAGPAADGRALQIERGRMAGEVQGLGLRVREAEEALAAQHAVASTTTKALQELRREHALLMERMAVQHAEAERAAELMGTVIRLEHERATWLAEREARSERDGELAHELRQVRDELAEAQQALAHATVARDAAELARGQLEAEAEAARQAARAAQTASGDLASGAAAAFVATLGETREALVEIGRAIYETTHDLSVSTAFESVSGPPSPAPASEGSANDASAPARVVGDKDLENALEALDAERAAHAATSASVSRKLQQLQSDASENAKMLEILRGRLRRVAQAAEALRARVPANDRLASQVAELHDLTHD